MDVREKLVELIFESLCRHIHKSCKLAENIADDLISNGVTAQEWISVKDRLPDMNEEVFAVYKNSLFENGPKFTKVLHREGKHWVDRNGYRYLYENITYWMPLPQPPKGEWQ